MENSNNFFLNRPLTILKIWRRKNRNNRKCTKLNPNVSMSTLCLLGRGHVGKIFGKFQWRRWSPWVIFALVEVYVSLSFQHFTMFFLTFWHLVSEISFYLFFVHFWCSEVIFSWFLKHRTKASNKGLKIKLILTWFCILRLLS